MGVERPTGSRSWVPRRKGEFWGPSFIPQSSGAGQALSVVPGSRADVSPALQQLLLRVGEKSSSRAHSVCADDCHVQLIYRK